MTIVLKAVVYAKYIADPTRPELLHRQPEHAAVEVFWFVTAHSWPTFRQIRKSPW